MFVRNPLLILAVSSSLLIACGPAETSPSQNTLSEIESRLARVESTVDNPETAVSGEAVQQIAVQPPAFALNVGDTKKIELITLTTASGDKTVLTGFNVLEMSIEDTGIATISDEGEVLGVKAGTTILEIGLGKNKKSLPVVVLEGNPVPSPTPAPSTAPVSAPSPTPAPTATPLPSNDVKAVSLSPSSMTLSIGQTEIISRIFVTLNDADETIGALNSVESAELSTSNSSVATVSTNGVVTAIGNGTAKITAIYKGVEGILDVTVEEDNE